MPQAAKLIYGEDDRVGGWIYPRFGGDWYPGRAVTIGCEEDGELIAGVAFENYNGASVFMSCAIEDGKHVGKEFVYALFAYAFIQLGVKKLLGAIDEANTRAIAMAESFGLKLECEIPDAHPEGAIRIYSMAAADCPSLGEGVPHA